MGGKTILSSKNRRKSGEQCATDYQNGLSSLGIIRRRTTSPRNSVISEKKNMENKIKRKENPCEKFVIKYGTESVRLTVYNYLSAFNSGSRLPRVFKIIHYLLVYLFIYLFMEVETCEQPKCTIFSINLNHCEY